MRISIAISPVALAKGGGFYIRWFLVTGVINLNGVWQDEKDW